MADPCQNHKNTLASLEAERDGLQAQLHEASTGQKAAIAAQVRMVNQQITKAKADLAACINRTSPQPVSLTITLRSLHCQRETGEFGVTPSDEPYVIVYTADMTTLPAPRSDVAWTGVMTDVDEGEARNFNVRVWGFNGAAQIIRSPDNVILLAAVVEHDESSASAVVSAVRLGMQAELVRAAANRLDRTRMVQTLTDAMRGAIGAAVLTGVPNPDDLLSVRELPLTPTLLRDVAFGGRADAFLDLGGGGGAYRLKFELARA